MTRENISIAVSNISENYIKEAESFHIDKTTAPALRLIKHIAPIAACAAILLYILTLSLPAGSADEPGSVGIDINLNEIADYDHITEPNALFSLFADDYLTMTLSEILKYYGVDEDITSQLNVLEPSLMPVSAFGNPEGFPISQQYGIYKSADRGVYYDTNSFLFADEGETKKVCITLAKAFKMSSDVFPLLNEELQFTHINGRQFAIFHYINGDGNSCYHVEFTQGDLAYYISAENISSENFVKYLQSIVTSNSSWPCENPSDDISYSGSSSVHVIAGQIIALDLSANFIAIKPSEIYGCDALGITPAKGEAKNYSLHDYVKVTFNGEPATVNSIWNQQLINIEVISE